MQIQNQHNYKTPLLFVLVLTLCLALFACSGEMVNEAKEETQYKLCWRIYRAVDPPIKNGKSFLRVDGCSHSENPSLVVSDADDVQLA